MKPKSGSKTSSQISGVNVSGVIKAYKSHLIECKNYKKSVLNAQNKKIDPLCIKLCNVIKGYANNTKDMVECLQQENEYQLKSVFEKQGDEFNRNFLFVNFLAEQESHKMVIDFHKTIIPIVGDENLYPEWY